jgi:hypothetical protein
MLTVAVLLAFAAFQALMGCNSTPAPVPGPQAAGPPAAPPAPAATPAMMPGNPTILLGRIDNNKWKTQHRVGDNDVITWKSSDMQFYIVFKAGNNPCSQDTFGGAPITPNVYNSKQVGKHWEAQCTVTNTKATKPWEYVVGDKRYPAPTYPGKANQPFPVIPCDGCRVADDLTQ